MKTIAVTGATSGIGFAVCAELLKRGFRVIAVGHSANNCRMAQEKLFEQHPAAEIVFYDADLLQQSEVRRVAGLIRDELDKNSGGKLDALVNNAGCVRSWYMTTTEGYEHQFALNHLAGFLLTNELLPNLRAADGRVLLTSSGSHKIMRMRWDDLMFERHYNPLLAYKQSKLCNMLFAFALNEREMLGVRAYGVDPGLVRTKIGNKSTGKLVDLIWRVRSRGGVDPSVPAQVYAELIERDDAPDGLYYGASGLMRASGEVRKDNADRLFALSEQLCHIKFGVNESCLS